MAAYQPCNKADVTPGTIVSTDLRPAENSLRGRSILYFAISTKIANFAVGNNPNIIIR